MTTFSDEAQAEQPCRCGTAADGRSRPAADPDLSELFHRFRRRIDAIRASGGAGTTPASGPSELALTVVAEALAIGEAMSRISVDPSIDGAENPRSPAIYTEIDSRFVEHRARALRSALHGVDDYVWWGGLAAAG